MKTPSTLVATAAIACLISATSACFCPLDFTPVCCEIDGVKKTVSNACFCNGCDRGGKLVSRGSCPVSLPTPTEDGYGSDCACSFEHAPVCCETRGIKETKSNSCFCNGCDRAGKIISRGSCPVSLPIPTGDDAKNSDCVCSLQQAPVCCDTNGVKETKSNSCFCNGCGRQGKALFRGECPVSLPTPTRVGERIESESKISSGIACPAVYAPVCCATRKAYVTAFSSCDCVEEIGGRVVQTDEKEYEHCPEFRA